MMLKNEVRVAAAGLVISVLGFSCGKDSARHDGMLAKIGGEIVHVPDSDADKVCVGDVECEPNYIYTASFGRSKPRPSPSPTSPPAEQADYSRAIMKVKEAWEISRGTSEVIVAVIDSGVAIDHPDLAQNIWTNDRELNGTPGVDDDGNGYVDDVRGYDFANNRANGVDDNGHGTHCAGIIAALQNGVGTVGVAPNVKIMPLKFLDGNGSGSSAAAIKAIDYAVANGAHIISNSWGGGGRSDFLDQAIQRAIQQGILVTAAAGNEKTNNDSRASYPAGYANVISVASSNEQDGLSDFSNFGTRTVKIAASGSNIFSTYLSGGYKVLSGTSMATPQVSGALALALSVNRGIARDVLVERLCSSSDSILRSSVSCGRLNVLNLLNAVK